MARVADHEATRYERWAKPAIDRLLALLLVVLLAPVLLVVAGAVALSVGRPLFFRQQRVGRGGATFDMWKFRTMLPDRRRSEPFGYGGPDRRRTHKSADDPRHTRVGRLLRKLSLDELPQLFNVLRGDMSLVGPRPELSSVARTYLPWQQQRHVVKPGVTGLWQTTARGDGHLLHECVDLDLRYIDQLSFRRDVAILLRTPVALLRNKGVV